MPMAFSCFCQADRGGAERPVEVECVETKQTLSKLEQRAEMCLELLAKVPDMPAKHIAKV